MHRLKTEIKKSSGQIFCVNIAYLKENSKIKDKFFKKILTQKIRTLFLAPKWGVNLYYWIDLYTGKYGVLKTKQPQ
mgnify:CR=1 FL=1